MVNLSKLATGYYLADYKGADKKLEMGAVIFHWNLATSILTRVIREGPEVPTEEATSAETKLAPYWVKTRKIEKSQYQLLRELWTAKWNKIHSNKKGTTNDL